MKTYKSINSVNLFTSIELNGKSTSLAFTGGHTDNSGKVTNGTFSTDDEKLQKAIEADSSYGKSFILVGQTVEFASANNSGNTGGDFEEIEGVANTQAAVEWLTANKQTEFDKNPKAAEVKAKALELKVDFVNWK